MLQNISNNLHLIDEKIIITPNELKRQFPLSKIDQNAITKSRHTIADIIHGRDPRLLVICGPCSINDIDAACDYAYRLQDLSMKLSNKLYIAMRVYFEKPRTIIGWKGLINDPYMDGSLDIESGLKIARNLLLKLIKINLPLATEMLDPNNPQYLGDLFSWSAIGARTTESQPHREIASALATPVGFKNGTHGNLETAINAIRAAALSHRFMGVNQAGQLCLLQTYGNPNGHIILRGSSNKPNYYPKDIISCEKKMAEAEIPISLMIDCSHSNSSKDYRRQTEVAQSVLAQIKEGNRSIIGLMLESYINAGNQSAELPREDMRYGVSITDACIDWKSTNNLLYQLHNELP
ncbi:3-deoxy-7-phosphoheptulonate synthase [Candidatus Curculioniphilus buchneri]|uniref:3-deoxy-7-phosphoheptulonate synthase n=1 Tax=Candidatus Curculioniphilus buchneri TaxID=690594 RepID=UPI00376ED4BB